MTALSNDTAGIADPQAREGIAIRRAGSSVGDAGARPTAELIAREIDNPALSAELQAASV